VTVSGTPSSPGGGDWQFSSAGTGNQDSFSWGNHASLCLRKPIKSWLLRPQSEGVYLQNRRRFTLLRGEGFSMCASERCRRLETATETFIAPEEFAVKRK